MPTSDEKCSTGNEIITFSDLATITRRIFGDTALKILHHSLSPFSEHKLGNTTTHRQLKITVQKENLDSSETVNFFVKTLPYESKQLLDLIVEGGVFAEEQDFYEKLVPELTKGYTAEKWSPKCYLVKSGTIVLEDLRSQGYKRRAQTFDDPTVLKSALTSIARFHGCGIAAETRLVKRSSQKHANLMDFYPNRLENRTFSHSRQSGRLWLEAGTASMVAVAEKVGLDPELVRRAFERSLEIVRPSEKHRNVICHSDLSNDNLMFDDAEPMPKCLLVDFQLCRYGPMVQDLLQFLYLNSTRSYRDSHEKELVQFYHGVLEETIGSGDVSEEARCPSFEELLEAYEDLRLYGALVATTHLPVILLAREILDLLESDYGSDNLLFGDRASIVLEAMGKDEAYKNKIVNAVTELVELAALHC